MNQKTLLNNRVGIAVGVIVTLILVVSLHANNTNALGTMGMYVGSARHDMANRSTGVIDAQLKGKAGDAFEKLFFREMIDHHQPAVDMAALIEGQARHEELKEMAEELRPARSRGIDQMQARQGD